ncbi:hypothetical protein Tco_0368983 [Tanacetum coccineum]
MSDERRGERTRYLSIAIYQRVETSVRCILGVGIGEGRCLECWVIGLDGGFSSRICALGTTLSFRRGFRSFKDHWRISSADSQHVLQQDSPTEEAETESNVWDDRSEDVNPFSGGNPGFHDDHYDNPFFQEEPILLVEEESCPVYDTNNEEEEESMLVYDTDIEDVIEEEEGFVRKGGFSGEEDNLKDVVVVAIDPCSLMIQTILSVDFEEDINTKSYESMSSMVLMVKRNRGEHLIRGFVGQGNEPDPCDVKIASLEQRIQELEFPQLQQDSPTEEAETESNIWDDGLEDVNPFGRGNPGFHDDHYNNPLLTKETESKPIIWDIRDEEEEYPFINKYLNVIEEEEEFVKKGGFGEEEDNIEDVVVVANYLCSSMIQTILSVDFEEDINTKSHELMSFGKKYYIKSLSILLGQDMNVLYTEDQDWEYHLGLLVVRSLTYLSLLMKCLFQIVQFEIEEVDMVEEFITSQNLEVPSLLKRIGIVSCAEVSSI